MHKKVPLLALLLFFLKPLPTMASFSNGAGLHHTEEEIDTMIEEIDYSNNQFPNSTQEFNSASGQQGNGNEIKEDEKNHSWTPYLIVGGIIISAGIIRLYPHAKPHTQTLDSTPSRAQTLRTKK